jgi:DNA-binding CsgD family transcriptional regulator
MSVGYHRQPTATGLTPRGQQILQLLADGHTQVTVAAHLYIEVSTVKEHLKVARQRLGARTTVHAVATAIRQGTIQ